MQDTLFLAPALAAARGLVADRVRAPVGQSVEGPSLRFLGEVRVDVLALNLALERTR
jgi:K+-transporting ATPase c subunit